MRIRKCVFEIKWKYITEMSYLYSFFMKRSISDKISRFQQFRSPEKYDLQINAKLLVCRIVSQVVKFHGAPFSAIIHSIHIDICAWLVHCCFCIMAKMRKEALIEICHERVNQMSVFRGRTKIESKFFPLVNCIVVA